MEKSVSLPKLNMSRKQIIGLILTLAIMGATFFVSPMGGLTQMGTKAAFYAVAVLILLVFEVFHGGVTALFIFAAAPAIGLVSFQESAGMLGHSMFFLMIASFGMSCAMSKLPISKRILRFFIRRFGRTTKGLMFALSISTAIVSMFISNFPTLMMFLPMNMALLDMYKNEKDRKQTGRFLMILLPLVATIGGIATPVGNGCMMLGHALLSDAGYHVGFPRWALFGVPAAFIILPLTYLFLYKVIPPVEINKQDREKYIAELNAQVPSKMAYNEIITYILFALMVGAWFLTSLNTTLVMLLVCVGLLFPPFNIITWEEYQMETSWSTTLLLVAIVSISTVLTMHGVSGWMADQAFKIIPTGISPTLFILILMWLSFAILILVPTASAVTGLIIAPVIAIIINLGMNPIPFIVPMTFATAFALIVPFDALWLVPYKMGYFTLKENAKVGLALSIIVSIVISVWAPIAGKILGMM